MNADSVESERPAAATPEPNPLQADVDKWKALSRKNEERFKALSGEFDDFRKAQESDTRRLVEEARSEGRNAAFAEVSPKLVEAELRAAAAVAGAALPDAGFLNLGSFVGDDGDPDPARIENFVSSLPKKTQGRAYAQDIGLGRQGGAAVVQLTRADISKMSPQEINQARKEGRLDALMRGEV